MKWQLQHAKQRFSELVDRALEHGPQTVTRRGEDAVVILSVQDYRRLTDKRPDFKAFLMSAPDLDIPEIERDRSPVRDVSL